MEFKVLYGGDFTNYGVGRDRNRVEFKVSRIFSKQNLRYVEIETEWNLKIKDIYAKVVKEGGRDRNRVEFKVIKSAINRILELGRDRNRVEFKVTGKVMFKFCS